MHYIRGVFTARDMAAAEKKTYRGKAR